MNQPLDTATPSFVQPVSSTEAAGVNEVQANIQFPDSAGITPLSGFEDFTDVTSTAEAGGVGSSEGSLNGLEASLDPALPFSERVDRAGSRHERTRLTPGQRIRYGLAVLMAPALLAACGGSEGTQVVEAKAAPTTMVSSGGNRVATTATTQPAETQPVNLSTEVKEKPGPVEAKGATTQERIREIFKNAYLSVNTNNSAGLAMVYEGGASNPNASGLVRRIEKLAADTAKVGYDDPYRFDFRNMVVLNSVETNANRHVVIASYEDVLQVPDKPEVIEPRFGAFYVVARDGGPITPDTAVLLRSGIELTPEEAAELAASPELALSRLPAQQPAA